MTWIFLIVILFTPESEKLSILSLPSLIVMIVILAAMCIDNTTSDIEIKSSSKIKTHNISNIAGILLYSGQIMYATSSIPTLFTIRNTMKDRTQAPSGIVTAY